MSASFRDFEALMAHDPNDRRSVYEVGVYRRSMEQASGQKEAAAMGACEQGSMVECTFTSRRGADAERPGKLGFIMCSTS